MKVKRNSGSINWLAISGEGMTADAANNFIDINNLTVKPITDNYFAPTRICDYDTKEGLIAYLQNGENVLTLYCMIQERNIVGKRDLGLTYIPKKYSIKLNEDDSSAANGKTAFEYINAQFKAKYNQTLRVAFGLSPECGKCIPVPLNFGAINPDIYCGFYKADVSSAYATEACKTLPTMKGSKRMMGTHLPDELFPFAFYPEEGQLAIYGESKYAYNVPLAAKYTILCPACDYSLADILLDLYNQKEEAKDNMRQYYKDILNYFVGWLHWRPKNKETGKYAQPGDAEYNPHCPRYAAQAAVIKARCNARILDLRDEIENYRGNQVVLINTDAIGWVGHDMPHIYTKEKGLGNLVLEHKDAQAIILGSKRYQIKDRNGSLVTKWAGVKRDLTEKMKWGDIRNNEHKPRKRMWDWNIQRIRYKTQEELRNEKKI